MTDRTDPAHDSAAGDDVPVTEADRSLFRDAVGPVAGVNRGVNASALYLGAARHARGRRTRGHRRAARRAATDVETGDDLVYRSEGVQLSVMQRLRRSHYRCQAELDLHGMVVDVARRCLAVFLRDALDPTTAACALFTVRACGPAIAGPCSRPRSPAGCVSERSAGVLSARPNDGGTGAVYVLMRRLWVHSTPHTKAAFEIAHRVRQAGVADRDAPRSWPGKPRGAPGDQFTVSRARRTGRPSNS